MGIALFHTSTIFHSIRCVLAIGPLVLVLMSGTPTAVAQMPTPAMVETHMNQDRRRLGLIMGVATQAFKMLAVVRFHHRPPLRSKAST